MQGRMLTQNRVRLAYAVAIAADVLQFVLGPFGWPVMDDALDVVAAAITWKLLGFHPLLLPTFVLEAVPIADLLPTWTACVAIVVAMRRRQMQTWSQP